jgi:hypothetical protein
VRLQRQARPWYSPHATSRLPSAGITQLHRSYGPLRHPTWPGLALASCQLIACATTAGASRVASGPLCVHAVANTPAGLVEPVRSYCPINFGLPSSVGGSAPALYVSRPAQRSLTLRPVRSPSHHVTLYTGGSDGFVASTAAPIATEWNEPVLGWDLHPQWTSAFHGAQHSSTRSHYFYFFVL